MKRQNLFRMQRKSLCIIISGKCNHWRIQGGWGMHPHRHPQCTETGHFEVQDKKKISGEGLPPAHSPHPTPSWSLAALLRPHPPPTISGSATEYNRDRSRSMSLRPCVFVFLQAVIPIVAAIIKGCADCDTS